MNQLFCTFVVKSTKTFRGLWKFSWLLLGAFYKYSLDSHPLKPLVFKCFKNPYDTHRKSFICLDVVMKNYSIGHSLLPIAAKKPHQLNMASKRVKPAKNRSTGLIVVMTAQVISPRAMPKRMSLPDLLMFLDTPLSVPFAKRLRRER